MTEETPYQRNARQMPGATPMQIHAAVAEEAAFTEIEQRIDNFRNAARLRLHALIDAHPEVEQALAEVLCLILAEEWRLKVSGVAPEVGTWQRILQRTKVFPQKPAMDASLANVMRSFGGVNA
jgi:hypothetical protein